MSEIQYYGGSNDSNATPFFGATVRAWSKINSARTALNSVGIQVPYVYIMSMDEAAEVNSKSFTFPLRVWVSRNEDEVYTPPKFASNAKAFRSILSECDESCTIIVSRSPIKHDNSIMYLGVDGWVIRGENHDFHYPMAFDFSSLWKQLNLPDNLVLRLRYPSSENWVIDGLIDRSNPFVNEYFGKPATEVNEKAFEAFRFGFVNGYNASMGEYIEHLHSATLPFGEQYRISENEKLARFQGYCAGQEAKYQAGQHFHAISADSSEQEKVKVLASLNQNTISKLQNLGFLHNAIVDGDREEVANRLTGFFSSNVDVSWQRVRVAFNSVAYYMNSLNKSAPKTKKWDDYSTYLEFDAGLEFDLQDTINFDSAQFRILSIGEGQLSIRFQSDTLSGSRKAIMSNGTVHDVFEWAKQKVELTFNVSDWSPEKLKALQSLTYSQASHAGTPAKYAPCIIKDDMIVAIEGDVPVTSLNSLKEQVAAYFKVHSN